MSKHTITILIIHICIFFNCTEKAPSLQNEEADNNSGLKINTPSQDEIIYEVDQQTYKFLTRDKNPDLTNSTQAPDWIIKKSREYVIDHVGRSYFDQYFTIRSVRIIPGRGSETPIGYTKYVVSYFYEITIDNYHSYYTVATSHDSTGLILRHAGIVDRINNPKLGMPFATNDTIAVQTVRNNGYVSTNRPWTLHFYFYHGDINRYVWNVSGDHGNIILDASNGEILFKGKTILAY